MMISSKNIQIGYSHYYNEPFMDLNVEMVKLSFMCEKISPNQRNEICDVIMRPSKRKRQNISHFIEDRICKRA